MRFESWLSGLLATILLVGSGCARGTTSASVADEFGSPDEELDFWDGLAQAPRVTNRDALHALLLSSDKPAEKVEDYAGAVREARLRGWLKASFDAPGNESAEIGWIAVAIVKEMKIKGGVTMRAFGASPRYAVRELVWLDLLPERSPNEAISGPELISLLGHVEDRRRGDTDLTVEKLK